MNLVHLLQHGLPQALIANLALIAVVLVLLALFALGVVLVLNAATR